MLKTILTLIVIFVSLTYAAPVQAESKSNTHTFQIIVRIPESVNMDAQSIVSMPTQTAALTTTAKQEIAIRDNREVVLKTQVTL